MARRFKKKELRTTNGIFHLETFDYGGNQIKGRTSMTYKVKMAGKMMSIYYSKRISSSKSIHYEEVGYCVAESREVVGN